MLHTTDTPEQLIQRLAESPNYPYPRAIIEEMIERKEEMIPALLHVLEDASRQPDYYCGDDGWKPLTFACFLLAQFREVRALRPICSILSLPGGKPDALFGDTLTESMGRILASTYGGNDQPLRELVENREVYEYVRGAAIPSCYLCLIQAGTFQRDALEVYVGELLETRLERTPNHVWNGIASLCADLSFASHIPLIEKAFGEGLCDPMFYDLKELVRVTKTGGESDYWKRRAILISDTIEETEWWHCFEAPEPFSEEPPKHFREANLRLSTKVGRNDPCPCASGLKYKKCCGGV